MSQLLRVTDTLRISRVASKNFTDLTGDSRDELLEGEGGTWLWKGVQESTDHAMTRTYDKIEDGLGGFKDTKKRELEDDAEDVENPKKVARQGMSEDDGDIGTSVMMTIES